MADKRKTPRKPVKLTGTITVPAEAKKIERVCEIFDISDNGMRMETIYFRTIRPGTLFHATIILDDPQHSTLEVTCLVRNMRKDNFSLMMNTEFENLDESQLQAIKSYVSD